MLVGNMLSISAKRYTNKPALVSDRKVMTYQELNNRVNCLANNLLQIGIKKGDRVAVLLHNCCEYVEIFFACAKIGSIFVPLNNQLKEEELKVILGDVTPRLLFFDYDYEELANLMRESLEFIEFYIKCGRPSIQSTKHYDFLIQEGKSAEPEIIFPDDSVLSIYFTSGTTGRAKGAMRTHRQEFINAMANLIELNIKSNDRTLLLMPFYHLPFVDNTVRHILMGNTIVIRREGQFNAREVLEIISREKITICWLVPTMINALIQEEDIESYDLSHFRLLTYAGSPIPVSTLQKALERFNCQFVQLYGQTESGPAITVLRPEDHVLHGSKSERSKIASAGRPVLGVDVRIQNEKGVDIDVGEVGEIISKGDALMKGYWNLPKETSNTIKDGWLHTGDMGRFDEEGYLYIVDRKHDMIISGGKNIYPREIEELLYRHEAILEASVIGVPDDYWGESVKALVVLKEGMTASEEEIIAFCKENLASYKKPRSVEFRKELPKSPAGKILKRIIREEYWVSKDRRV